MTDEPKPKAWQQGYNAARKGLPYRNPYPADTDEAFAWISGYVEGKAKPLRSVRRTRP
jgi:hypothetical protein